MIYKFVHGKKTPDDIDMAWQSVLMNPPTLKKYNNIGYVRSHSLVCSCVTSLYAAALLKLKIQANQYYTPTHTNYDVDNRTIIFHSSGTI